MGANSDGGPKGLPSVVVAPEGLAKLGGKATQAAGDVVVPLSAGVDDLGVVVEGRLDEVVDQSSLLGS